MRLVAQIEGKPENQWGRGGRGGCSSEAGGIKVTSGKASALGNAGDRTAVGLGHREELLPEEQSCGNAEGGDSREDKSSPGGNGAKL